MMMKKMNMKDIDFVLSHFQDQLDLFPRKMMTFKSNGQFSITSKEDIFERCRQSNFIDCRVNAYPEYTEYKGIVRQPPNFIFIDLDLKQFDDDIRRLNLALKKTLSNMKKVHGYPTVLWTGNGYHIYQPFKDLVLESRKHIFKG